MSGCKHTRGAYPPLDGGGQQAYAWSDQMDSGSTIKDAMTSAQACKNGSGHRGNDRKIKQAVINDDTMNTTRP